MPAYLSKRSIMVKRDAKDCCDVPCYKEDVVERLRKDAPPDDAVVSIASLFAVLADPTRVRLLSALAGGDELCVCDIANVVGLTLSATSHQLRKLRDAGVVEFRNDGRMAYYRLRDGFTAGLLAQARVHVSPRSGKRGNGLKVVQQ